MAGRAKRKRTGAAAVAAAALTLALGAGCGGEPAPETSPSTPTTTSTVTTGTAGTAGVSLVEAAARVRAQLADIPQDGLLLGSPTAPVTIIEYAGFDCAACASVHATVVPAVIERLVRSGEASLELRLLAAGAHDLALALGAHGARPQDRAWEMVQLQYLRSTDPDATGETTATHARALGLDVPRWRRDTARRQWATELQAALSVFKIAKWGVTPVFLVRRLGLDGPFEVVSAPSSPDEVVAAFDAALAR